MRIYAKKLRYTMEVFAPLYKNKLAKEIETITAFQDVLGEMHDCDVWVDYIPKFIDKAKTKIKSKGNKKEDTAKFEKALFNFLAYIKEQRKGHYDQFVRLWNKNKNNNFFVQLRKTTNTGLSRTKAKTKQLLANPDVKIAVLSDVHANLQALEKVGLNGWESHTPSELSGGQQQRVAIARAIVTGPEVLLADEPTGNLDTERSREIMELLTCLNRDQGITIIMITHEPEMAAYARHTIHFLDGLVVLDEHNGGVV